MTNSKKIIVAGLACIALFSCEEESPRIDYPDPVADFEPGVVTSFSEKPILFPHELSEEATYYWDFGDGNKDTTDGWFPTHTYAQAGKYEVTLTVVGQDASDDITKTIEVLPPFEQLLTGGSCKTWKLIRRYERERPQDSFREVALDSCDQVKSMTFCADYSASDENWYCGRDEHFTKWEFDNKEPQLHHLRIVTNSLASWINVDISNGNLIFGNGLSDTLLLVFEEE